MNYQRQSVAQMVSEVLENKRRLKCQNQNTQEKELLENTQKELLEETQEQGYLNTKQL